MSDGEYSLDGQEAFYGLVEVSQGKFQGENDDYQYQGIFSIQNNMLKGVVTIVNKLTERVSRAPLNVEIRDDEDFKIEMEIEGKETFLHARKHRPESHKG